MKYADVLSLHPKYQNAMRNMGKFLLALAALQLVSWLLPSLPEFKGIPNYLPLHTFLEAVSIVVSMMVFAAGWNSHSRNLSGNIVLLACVSFSVGLLDFSHTISYGGRPDFISPNDAQKHLNFWLSARSFECLALLAVAIRPSRQLISLASRNLIFISLVVVTLLINWVVIFHQSWLPNTFIQGQGLTAFKKNVEYIIIILNIITAAILWSKMHKPQHLNVVLLFGAACTLAMSEFYFTLYTTMTGSYNVLGHIYKVIAYFFIYRAIVVEVIEEPYSLLEQERMKYSNIFDSVNDGIEMISKNGRIVGMNRVGYERMGYTRQEIIGRPLAEFVAPEFATRVQERMDLISTKGHVTFESARICKDGSVMPLEISSRMVEMDGQQVFLGICRDMTERKLAEQAIRDSAEALNKAQEIAKIGSWHVVFGVDASHDMWTVSKELRKIWGLSEETKIVTQGGFAEIHPEDRIAMQQNWDLLKRGQGPAEWSHRIIVDGQIRWIHVVAKVTFDRNGNPLEASGTNQDITERASAESKINELNRDFVAFLENTSDFIYFKDVNSRIRFCSQTLANVTGHANWRDMVGKHDFELFPKDTAQIYYEEELPIFRDGKPLLNKEDPYYDAEGNIGWVSTNKWPLLNQNNEVVGLFGISRDITEHKRMEEQVRQLAFYDTLTNLPNRRLLSDRIAQSMVASKRSNCYGALLFLDLDNFKPLNDMHGHVAGDLLLIEVANRLKNCVREIDTVARLGGDEFVVLLSELDIDKATATTQAQLIAEKISAALAETYSLAVSSDATLASTIEHRCTASIGVAMFIHNDNNQADIIKRADTAMYQAKEAGRNSIRLYSECLV